MGTHTLTVAPGQTVTSGTAAITLGNLTLTGNPVLAVNDSAAVNGKLTTGSLLGGGIARTITKTGAGDLSVTGGSTDLPAGSTFTATGGGIIELLFPDLGTDTTVNIAAAQNPLGQSTISITDGGLRLIANGANTTTPQQTFVLPSTVTLGGSVTLDPDRKSARRRQDLRTPRPDPGYRHRAEHGRRQHLWRPPDRAACPAGKCHVERHRHRRQGRPADSGWRDFRRRLHRPHHRRRHQPAQSNHQRRRHLRRRHHDERRQCHAQRSQRPRHRLTHA